MKKIWIHKSDSFEEAEKFDRDYYLNIDAKKRLETIQWLRETYFNIKKGIKGENRKRLRRVIKIV